CIDVPVFTKRFLSLSDRRVRSDRVKHLLTQSTYLWCPGDAFPRNAPQFGLEELNAECFRGACQLFIRADQLPKVSRYLAGCRPAVLYRVADGRAEQGVPCSLGGCRRLQDASESAGFGLGTAGARDLHASA